jgi:predicted peptidase
MRRTHRLTRALGAAGLLALHPLPLSSQAVQTGFLDRRVTVAGNSYGYQVFVPETYTPSRPWPVILFLHGAGERGIDGLLQTQVGLAAAVRQNPARFPAIIVFPQAPPESIWTGVLGQVAIAALDRTTQEFRTDPTRMYLTGISMGGNGAWYLAYRYPSRFAALIPVCGWVTHFGKWTGYAPVIPADSGSPLEALARQLRHVPIWIVHGEIDPVVPVEESRRAAASLKAAGAPVRYLELPGTAHDAWDAAYGSPKLLTWLFSQRRR